MDSWEKRNTSQDIISQKQSDATLGLERIYDTEKDEIYMAKNGWSDRDKIKSLGKVFDLSYSTVFGYIRIYAKQYLGMSNEEYKELLIKKDKDGLDRRITNWINGSFERKKTYECCRGNTYQELNVDDNIRVVFNGDVMESDPLQIGTVYTIYLLDENGEVIPNN